MNNDERRNVPHTLSSLRQLVRERATALASSVEAKGEPPPANDVEELRRLADLADLAEAALGADRWRRWYIVGAVALTAVIVSFLLFSRTPSTEVELDLHVGQAAFVTSGRQGIVDDFQLASLGLVTSCAWVSLFPRDYCHADQPPLALKAVPSASAANRGAGQISIRTLIVPPGTRITMSKAGESRGGRLVIMPSAGQAVEFTVSLRRAAVSVSRGSKPKTVTAGNNRAAVAMRVSSHSELVLDLVPAPGTALALRQGIDITGLSVDRVEQYYDGTRQLPRRVSSLTSGELVLESVNAKKLSLQPFDGLTFATSRGTLRSLSMKPERFSLKQAPGSSLAISSLPEDLSLRFHGFVSGMSGGTAVPPRPLMPSYLEWLAAQQGLWLLWGTLAYATTLILGLFGWFWTEKK